MAAFTTTSGAEAAAAAATAPVATALGAGEIDFDAEAQARGMKLVSCKVRSCWSSEYYKLVPGGCRRSADHLSEHPAVAVLKLADAAATTMRGAVGAVAIALCCSMVGAAENCSDVCGEFRKQNAAGGIRMFLLVAHARDRCLAHSAAEDSCWISPTANQMAFNCTACVSPRKRLLVNDVAPARFPVFDAVRPPDRFSLRIVARWFRLMDTYCNCCCPLACPSLDLKRAISSYSKFPWCLCCRKSASRRPQNPHSPFFHIYMHT